MTKTGLIIRHVPHEGIAGYREPIEAAGYALDRIDVGDPAFAALDLAEPDLLIMMGGPMGVYERDRHPWIACQLRRLARRLEADRPTLGVCFGAQMMAAAMGARVYSGPAKEIGFAPLMINGPPSPLRHLEEVAVLHWHGDTFDLPDGAELLASTGAYAHQAFRRGRNILALQFHAEMGLDPRFDEWVDQWPEAIVEVGNSADGIRRDHTAHGPAAVAAGRLMVGEWLAELDG
ncbi:GMP synthase (glutamine-hydrolysing) [Sphingopyxis panaciterrae]|uniref:glutamine amidotransferase n=1 Tax=Sphingopyxis panaciterrae TaxID=363841 RepID=UPI001422870C|nr:glutamine amidotransferase [Sphingopyxis panaciterrae]NIJ38326.1 GMP synthase (glutamine-hydrolysing) [Sphingopyxis panaciterrae]